MRTETTHQTARLRSRGVTRQNEYRGTAACDRRLLRSSNSPDLESSV